MPLDPTAATLIQMLDQVFPKVEEYRVADDARAFLAANRTPLPVDEVARVENHVAPGADGAGVVVRVYWPADDGAHRPGVVFFHGGGWVICDLDSHDGLCRRMANALDAVVVSVDYRKAPEHKFPAAAEDAYSALQWVAQNAPDLLVDESRLAVAGDSAGGNLAAVTALVARDRGGPELVYQLMIYPVTDVSTERDAYPSRTENAEGYFLTAAAMEWYRDQYLASDADAEHPYCSPIRAESLAGLPPAFVLTAEYDPLRDEGERYGERLREAGVPTTVHRALGMFHGFFNMDAVLEGASEAQAVAFAAMRPAIHGPAR